ncbi:MAG: hypothetical protein N2255_07820, partial [Kiritimatiellae bacterium]|nr:hypothetical protein [Kiritimatiellia bacterium]
ILGRYRAVAVGGQAARRSVCTSFLTATNDVPFGRHTSPYDLVFACRGVDLAADGVIVDRRDLFHSVAVRLLKMQDTNGSWGRGLALWQSSAQFWYEDEKICKPAHEKEQASLPKEKRVPYDSKRAWTRRYIYAGRHVDSMDLPVVATCYAMLFLEDGLKRLGTGYIVGTNSVTPPKLLDAALYHLKQRDNMACQVCPVTTNTPLSTVRELPLLFADTRLDWDSAVAKSVFRSYTSGPGMVAFELTDIAKGPVVETKLGLLQPDGKFGDVKEGEEFISGYQGTRPRLRGFFGADGKLRVVLLPPNEVQTAYLLLKYRLSACRSEGAASLIASPDKSTKRVMLLQRLDEFAKASSLRVSGLEQKAAAPSATPAPPPTSDSQPPAAVPPTPAPRPETKPEDLKLPAPPVSEPRKPAEDEMW